MYGDPTVETETDSRAPHQLFFYPRGRPSVCFGLGVRACVCVRIPFLSLLPFLCNLIFLTLHAFKATFTALDSSLSHPANPQILAASVSRAVISHHRSHIPPARAPIQSITKPSLA